MQLLMTWPDNQRIFLLSASCTFENAACFNVQNGTFSLSGQEEQDDAIYFYSSTGGAVILNNCEKYICRVDDVEIRHGQTCILRFGAFIQLGNFTFEVGNDESSDHEDMLHNLLNVHYEEEKDHLIIPEVEDILPNGGHYTGDLRYFSDAMESAETETDVLKKLELEYKKFLIWGEQNRKFFDDSPEINNKLSGDDDYFDAIRDEMKTKTLTECIVPAPSLFEKVWKEMNITESYDELLGEEEKTDILKSLAPENISSKEKKHVPELVFHDLYKTGLDSLY
ncbi:TagK domain-containing protein [Erwinia mallotivora]|nr:TagK domain-containing protein [Erwinia mallotivora]